MYMLQKKYVSLSYSSSGPYKVDTSVQCEFYGCKNGHFQMINFDLFKIKKYHVYSSGPQFYYITKI